ncbi:hypothetical protein QKV36_gp051 [Erannis ankeraria nucleopolyhedrovirus]|uniref:hypothetical protein n=1 Tax=Erannis ankeraria nucleopolyhedrovirus TaxID=2913600 RepID=UPI00117A94A3|nr:hypothetical protein QKV36_gp051 [Erannis ankeraria nucleopolyhedrovirus]UJZ88999.1 hypothetical protein Erangp051 [Erannis ankeraria nucleopolyhedrovirus]
MDQYQEKYLRFVTYVHINGLIGRLKYLCSNINGADERNRKTYVEHAHSTCVELEDIKNNINCSYLVDIQSESVQKTVFNIPKCMSRRQFCNPITSDMQSAIEDAVYDLDDKQKKILRDAIAEYEVDYVMIGSVIKENNIDLSCDIEFTLQCFNMLYDELKNVCINYMTQ